MAKRPRIFLSYSHKDQNFANQLLNHLRPLERKYKFEVWSGRKIGVSDSWESAIKSELESADIAIILVSADYLASNWTATVELPSLLKQADQGIVRIVPIILRACAWTHTPLAYYQALPRDAVPLATLPEDKKDRVWSELYEVLEAELHRLSEANSPPESPTNTPQLDHKNKKTNNAEQTTSKGQESTDSPKDKPPIFFISHAKEDGDFAENLKGRMREYNFDGWIDIDVLEAGVDWRNGIDEAIIESHALILILSPDSKSSEYVTYEWAFALGSGLPIIPLMLRDTPIHPRLEIYQYLDFTNRRARPWSRLLNNLSKVSSKQQDTDTQPDAGSQ